MIRCVFFFSLILRLWRQHRSEVLGTGWQMRARHHPQGVPRLDSPTPNSYAGIRIPKVIKLAGGTFGGRL